MRNILTVLVIAASAVFGQTSDAPKRTLLTSDNQTASRLVKPTTSTDAPKPTPVTDNNRGASSKALDAMNSANEDLNIIRDSNVRGLNSGCSPESSSRIADLAARLQTLGVKVELPKSAAAGGNSRPGSDTAALTLASDWYKQTGDSSSPSSSSGPSGKDRKEDLLDSVLPGTSASAADVASLKGEFDRLVASCTQAKR